MRLSKLIGGIVVMVALGSMFTATAFKTAAVTNDVAITVSATNTAALAMSAAAVPDNGIAVTLPGGQLKITITDQMQPGSVYCFSPAFQVKNTGLTTPIFTFGAATITGMPGTAQLQVFKSGGTPCTTALQNTTLSPDGTTNVDLLLTIPVGTTLATSSPQIVINGTH